jgi:hypothetical protein
VIFLGGSAAALYYSHLGLALSHYDARAHLVVSRRVFDSLLPGWQQVGAVWLPLPHLLGMLPAQIDAFYKTGAFAIAISVLSMAVAAWALARLIRNATGSIEAGFAGAALLLANPNVLYLQSTPMTEPLLFGTTLLSIALVAEWIEADAPGMPHAPGLAIAAACMTRYEAWPITAALFALAAVTMLRRGIPVRRIMPALLKLAIYPAVAIVVFVCNSKWTTGEWFVDNGFFVAENEARGHLRLAWEQLKTGMYQLSGPMLVWPAYAAAILIVAGFVRSKARAPLLLLLALAASAVLPLVAYYDGHPLRVRYSVPLVFAASTFCAAGIGLLPRRLRALAAIALVLAVMRHQSPIDLKAPMVLEAQRDNPNRAGRQAVTAYLLEHYDGEVIMMSMGSLAHYMHDLSAQGFYVRNFLHEGNGELWVQAIEQGPHGFAGWVAVEEKAEGGDALFQRAQKLPQFFRGFERVAEGGGVALYRAQR